MESNSSRKDAFWIWLDVMWVWPLMLLLGTFDWFYPNVGLKLLAKSSWVLFAGICQTWILVVADRKHRVRPKWFVPVLVGLSWAGEVGI